MRTRKKREKKFWIYLTTDESILFVPAQDIVAVEKMGTETTESEDPKKTRITLRSRITFIVNENHESVLREIESALDKIVTLGW